MIKKKLILLCVLASITTNNIMGVAVSATENNTIQEESNLDIQVEEEEILEEEDFDKGKDENEIDQNNDNLNNNSELENNEVIENDNHEESKDDEKEEAVEEDNTGNDLILNSYDSFGGQAWSLENIAELVDINIVTDTEIKKETAKAWAKSQGATQEFIDLVDLYWKYSDAHGNVNPAIAFVQSAKETGFGKFGGIIDSSFKNPCGLKTREGGADNDPNAHQRFNSWDDGVRAHLDHLALYAGADGYPRKETFDPRHFPSICGKAKTVTSLGGNWAPSPTYGKEILKRYYDMLELNEGSEDFGWNEENGYKYYIDENGNRVKGLNTIDGHTYYMDENGYLSYDWQFVNGAWRYFNPETGIIHVGWLLLEDWYYLKSDGAIAQGREVVDGVEYYFNESGRMLRNWQFIDGTWSYFNDGQMHKGWLLLEDWYYLKSDGKIAQGREVVDGVEYYFNESGRMLRNWQFIDGAWSYFNDGQMHKGWLLLEDWYYLKSDGKIAQGREVVDGIEYYFNESGRMLRNWQFIDGAWSYFNDGQMHRGWLLLEDWYYLKNDGKIAQGREIIDSVEYYFNESGRMLRHWQFVDGGWSYFVDGIKHKGWLEENGNKYYLDFYGKMSIGWTFIGDDMYYFNESGIMQTNTVIDGYQIGADGKVIQKLVNIVDLNFEFDFGLEGPKPNNPQKLILHHAAGNTTVENVHDYHKYTNGWAGIGYHFYIHKDGTIYKGRNEEWRGAHAAEIGSDDGDETNDTNATSLGISVQGDYTSSTMPKVQEDAVVDLGKYLVKKYGMASVFRHGDPGIGHTNCPGNKYPFERIKGKILSDVVYGVYQKSAEN